MFRVGLRLSNGITDVESINQIADDWVEAREDAEGDLSMSGISDMPSVNFEYGFQPYFSFRPWRLLQLSMKVDFIRSPNLYNTQSDDLSIDIYSAIPGVHALLTIRAFELGLGPVLSMTRLKWRDDFFGYHDTWLGDGIGMEAIIGVSIRVRQTMGFTLQLVYRNLQIRHLEDSQHRVLVDANSGARLEMNLSGVMIQIGVFFRGMETQGFFRE